MLKHAARTLMLLSLMAGMTFAQGPNTSTTMICPTADGIVRISDRSIALADYVLSFDSIVRDGVLRFVDARSGAVAELDARDSQGLYLEVIEGGVRMQVVASLAEMQYEQSDRGSEPASPSFSAVLSLIGAPARTK